MVAYYLLMALESGCRGATCTHGDEIERQVFYEYAVDEYKPEQLLEISGHAKVSIEEAKT